MIENKKKKWFLNENFLKFEKFFMISYAIHVFAFFPLQYNYDRKLCRDRA